MRSRYMGGVQETVCEIELSEAGETLPEENALEEGEILLEGSISEPEEIALETNEIASDPEEALDQETASAKPDENALEAKETTEEAKISLSEAGTTITKVELSTALNIPDMITPGADVEAIEDNKAVVTTGVQSEDGPLDPSTVQFDPGDSGWFFYDNSLGDNSDWSPYQEGTISGMNFFEGENQFRAWIYIPEDVDAVFAQDCEFTINGKRMEVLQFLNDTMDVYLKLSVYSQPTITKIWLTWDYQTNWVGKPVDNPIPIIKKIEGNTDIPDDAITVNAGWFYRSSGDYHAYHEGDVFNFGTNMILVQVIANDGYGLANGHREEFEPGTDYKGEDHLKVYRDDALLDYYKAFGSMEAEKADYYHIDYPEINIGVRRLGSEAGGKVSFDGSSWDSSGRVFVPLDSYKTLYAQADEGSEFVEWRKGYDGEAVSTNPVFNLLVDGSATYYAVFQKTLPTTGTLCDAVDYTFDPATGTVTLIPTKDCEGGSVSVVASVGNYGWSPFYQNTGIRHIIVQEGITGISDWVFQEVDGIETVSLPSTLSLVRSQAFTYSTLLGDGFTVAEGNEYFKAIDGSLFSLKSGELYGMLKFFQKPGQTEYTIPDGVEWIEFECFQNMNLDKLTLRGDGLVLSNYAICKGTIKDVVIEEGVIDLGNYSDFTCLDMQMSFPASLEWVGTQSTFAESEVLQAFDVPAESEHYATIDGVLYKKTEAGLDLVKYPYGRTDKDFTVPDGVVSIASSTWHTITNQNLKTITLPASVASIGDAGFFWLDGVTVTINNPDCTFHNTAFATCENITLKGYVGSTAQQYAADHGFAFVKIGGELGQLDKPANLRWEGNKATWDPVPNAARYDLKFYRKDSGMADYSHMDSQDIQISADTTEYDYSTLLWYQDSDYRFTITASATGYEPSETVKSPARNGRFSIRNMTPAVNGDVITLDFKDDEGELPGSYYLVVRDMDNNYINRCFIAGADTSANIRSLLSSIAPPYGTYKLYLEAYANSDQVGGWMIQIGEAADPIIYEYKDIPKISRIEVTIPDPVAGESYRIPADVLNLTAYCGDKVYEAVTAENTPWMNAYQYLNDAYSSWQSFDYKVMKGKYAYAYYLQVNSNPGYDMASDVEIWVNGALADASQMEILTIGSSIGFRYLFPEGTVIKTTLKNAVIEAIPSVTYTGSAIKPEPAVILEGHPLVKDVDYTLSYKNNKEVGTATVTAEGKGEYTGTAQTTFEITPVIPVSSVSLNRKTMEMATKTTAQLTATVKPTGATDKSLTWTSSNTSVATVNSKGKITAKARGTVTITATSKANSAKKATCKVTVKFNDAYYDLDGTGVSNVTKEMETAINWAADKKITGETVSFGTNNSMTRGQFVRFLYRYAGNPKVTSSMIKKYGSKFTDVDKSYTHYNAIVWAVSEGLINGYSDGTFKPNGTLTRNNVATILWKYAGSPKVSNPNNPFSDVDKSTAIAWGKSKGIFTGTKFLPKSNCLRGDFALFLYRYDQSK